MLAVVQPTTEDDARHDDQCFKSYFNTSHLQYQLGRGAPSAWVYPLRAGALMAFAVVGSPTSERHARKHGATMSSIKSEIALSTRVEITESNPQLGSSFRPSASSAREPESSKHWIASFKVIRRPGQKDHW